MARGTRTKSRRERLLQQQRKEKQRGFQASFEQRDKMTDKEQQELQEAITVLQMADCDRYAKLLQRLADFWELKCECSIRDGSNPNCAAHSTSCPCCGASPSHLLQY